MSASLTSIGAQTQKPSDYGYFHAFREEFIAPFKMVGDAPKGFEEFIVFYVDYLPGQKNNQDQLIPDKPNGHVPVAGGVLVKTEATPKTGRGKLFKFASSKITASDNEIRLSFTTKKSKDVNYVFDGQYFETGIAYPARDSTRLKGTLTKMKKGIKVAEAQVVLYPYIADVD